MRELLPLQMAAALPNEMLDGVARKRAAIHKTRSISWSNAPGLATSSTQECVRRQRGDEPARVWEVLQPLKGGLDRVTSSYERV